MPKNIVLLSDGTGNSSAQLLKTNVWRVYEALDLDDPNEQVACYDDGVGTSSFKPLALLGGAFGVGLKKNVLRLYRFLCEHYDEGDRIYAFGFSRGAFTIRVLIGLVAHQGIIRTRPTSPVVEAYPDGDPRAAAAAAHSQVVTAVRGEPQVFGKELARLTRWAYREFRREAFAQTGALVTIARSVRDVMLRLRERGARYDPARNHQVEKIEFLGLWDTVDAYGLPADELTEGVNKWIWPLSAQDLQLSPKVKKACHVIAIDDERNTFHPVLWDEGPGATGHRAPRRRTDLTGLVRRHALQRWRWLSGRLAVIHVASLDDIRSQQARTDVCQVAARISDQEGRSIRAHLRLARRPQGVLPLQPAPDRMVDQRAGPRVGLWRLAAHLPDRHDR